jgi:hypothetical protein
MKVLLFVFIASAIILAALAAMFPEVLLNPGPLMKGHHALENKCLSCHKPFAGAMSIQCISCHKQSDISVKNVAGVALPKDTTKVLFHRGVDANSCIDCHTDHRGTDAAKALKPFKHSSLPRLQQKECITCHKNKKPQDALHRYATGNCSECHATNKWKPATFDHNNLTAASGKQCINCHKADQPNDNLHLKVSTNCATCHTATAWKPATYDHDKYFRLDHDHKASCATCHTDPGNYKKYTCYNCHEHSPDRMARKHEKEGIFDYQNCIKCHRDASGEGGERGEGRGDDD